MSKKQNLSNRLTAHNLLYQHYDKESIASRPRGMSLEAEMLHNRNKHKDKIEGILRQLHREAWKSL